MISYLQQIKNLHGIKHLIDVSSILLLKNALDEEYYRFKTGGACRFQ
jgi:hypothetical protein